MDADVWAAIAAWAGFAATTAAGLYARSQARSARTALRETREAREAAQDQAHSARESALAARTSADAAVDSARSAREGVEIARKMYDRDDEPTFEITLIPQPNDGRVAAVAKRMLGGPPEIWVKATWHAQTWYPSSDPTAPNIRFTRGKDDTGFLIARGEQYLFLIRTSPSAYRGKVTVRLASQDATRRITHVAVALRRGMVRTRLMPELN